MATCKDCLHYELCQYNTYQEAHYFGKDKQIYITIKNNSICKFFKPTADVVEVVRCKDCKYQDDCARQMVHTTRDYVLEQNISTYNKVDFCSFGARKEVE